MATVVYEYVATAEPVGSNTLTQKYNLGVSSATIRNEMAELEAGGYLVQPHTSAGRIPSDAGYRTYVDQLMEPEALAPDDARRIADELREAGRELDGVIEQTTRLLGRLSRSVALAVAPRRETHAFRHVQLIWLSDRTGLAIVVSSAGVAAQVPFEHSEAVELDDLNRLSNRLNVAFAGKAIGDIGRAEVEREVREAGFDAELALAVGGAFAGASRIDDSPQIASSGTQHLLDQPEFQDLRKLRSILRIIEEQKTLYEIVADSINQTGPSVRIGQELGIDEITECSLVTVPYRMGDGMVGMLAILGPRRMPYGRLLALADGTAQSLNRYLSDADIR